MTTMKSFRFGDADLSNMEYLCDHFNCSATELISTLLSVYACKLNNYYETNSNEVCDVAFQILGCDWKILLDRFKE